MLAGSLARKKEVISIFKGAKNHRKQLVDDGSLVLKNDKGFYQFMRDVPFSSLSGAAAVVYGGNICGPANWKIEKDGQSYKDWRERQFDVVQKSDS